MSSSQYMQKKHVTTLNTVLVHKVPNILDGEMSFKR